MEKNNRSPESNQQKHGGAYLERFGENTKEMLEVLLVEPESPLIEPEKQEAYNFEHSLAGTELTSGITIEVLFYQSKGEELVAPAVYPEPFLDGKISHKNIEIPKFDTTEDVEWWALEAASDPNIDNNLLREVFNASTKAYKEKVADAIVNNTSLQDETFHCMSVVLDPQEAVGRARNLSETRAKLKEIISSLSSEPSELDHAKRAITEIYLSKTNALIAEQIPILEYAATGASILGDEATAQAAFSAMPQNLREAIKADNFEKVFKRLDFLRNGLGVDENSQSSGVSENVISAIDEQRLAGHESTTPKYTPEQIEKMKHFMLSPDQIAKHAENIFYEAGKLSKDASSATEAIARTGRASDNLWQVIQNPGKSTFEVDGTRGLYKTTTQNTSLFNVLTVGYMHELTHVNQSESDQKIGAVLRIANTKGKRVSGIREAGANNSQREYSAKLTGSRSRPSMTYVNALRALEQTGSVASAIEAFYDAKLETDPGLDNRKAALEAADRVMRLTRMGGINSQPMVYAEQLLLAHEIKDMSPAAQSRATSVTCLDFTDQIKLHKYGLLPALDSEIIDWEPFVENEMSETIKEAIGSQ